MLTSAPGLYAWFDLGNANQPTSFGPNGLGERPGILRALWISHSDVMSRFDEMQKYPLTMANGTIDRTLTMWTSESVSEGGESRRFEVFGYGSTRPRRVSHPRRPWLVL